MSKRSKMWPKLHAESEKKWKDIQEKVEAGERFSDHRGFAGLEVWIPCGYCKEFGDRYRSCSDCPLRQKVECEEVLLPVCNDDIDIKSVTSTFVYEMWKKHPNKEKCLKLIKIILEEIAKDAPGTTGQKQGGNPNAGW